MDHSATITTIHRDVSIYQRYSLMFVGWIITIFMVLQLLHPSENAYFVKPGQIFSELYQAIVDPLTEYFKTETASLNPVTLSVPTDLKPQTSREMLHKINVEPHDTIEKIFKQLNLDNRELDSILKQPLAFQALTQLSPSHTMEILSDNKFHLIELRYAIDKQKSLVLHATPEGYSVEELDGKLQEVLRHKDIVIQSSLYNAITSAHLPPRIAVALNEIFKYRINFSRDIRKGARIELVYPVYYQNNELKHTGNILAARITNHTTVYTAIQYRLSNGDDRYFDINGNSMEGAFLRNPVNYKYISSPFNLHRYHPVLHVVRAHTGVDMAARSGSPIVAASSGTIMQVGRYGGYGNAVTIKFDSKYSTLYGHMRRFAKGLRPGAHVKKGQVIGYVGMTGLADGPHLHYEVRVYGHPVNPMTVKLPFDKSIAGDQKRKFKAYADLIINKVEPTKRLA